MSVIASLALGAGKLALNEIMKPKHKDPKPIPRTGMSYMRNGGSIHGGRPSNKNIRSGRPATRPVNSGRPSNMSTNSGRPNTRSVSAGRARNLRQYLTGGSLPIGPDAERYEGPSHEQGGIPVDAQGNPNEMNPVAEVEGGETRQGDYIFSDELIVPGTEMTFAEAHEMLIAEGAQPEEIEQLQQMQEQVRAEQGVDDPMMAEQPMVDEEMPMMPRGGRIPSRQWTHQFKNQPYNQNVNRNIPRQTPQTAAPNMSRVPTGSTTPMPSTGGRLPDIRSQMTSSQQRTPVQRVPRTQPTVTNKLANFGKYLVKGAGRVLGGIGTVLTTPDAIGDSSLTGKYGDDYLAMILGEAENNNFEPLKEELIKEGYSEDEINNAISQINDEIPPNQLPEVTVTPNREIDEVDSTAESAQSPNQQRQLNIDTSIVDYLASMGMDNSFQARKELFEQEMGGENYRGTAEQNIKLLKFMRELQEGEIMQDNIEPEQQSVFGDQQLDPVIEEGSRVMGGMRKGGQIPQYYKYGGHLKKKELGGKLPKYEDGGFFSTENLQRYAPSAIDAGLALFTPRQKEFKPKTVKPETIRADRSNYTTGRNDIATSARTAVAGGANPSAVHARTLKGVSNLTAGQNQLETNVANQNAQNRQAAGVQNVQMQNQAQQMNLENRSRDTASRMNLLRNAVTRPLDMNAADKAGERKMMADITLAASNIPNEADRNSFMEMAMSLIRDGVPYEEAVQQATQQIQGTDIPKPFTPRTDVLRGQGGLTRPNMSLRFRN